MKKLLLIIIAFVFSNGILLSQINFSFRYGKGAYAMNELKQLNQIALQSLPVEAKITDHFPKTAFYEGSILYDFDKILFGLTYSYHTSGSRISYMDYSGELKYDQIISANTIGPILKLKLVTGERIKFQSYLSTCYIKTNYRSNDEVIVFTDVSNSSLKLKSSSLLINLGVEFLYSIKWFSIGGFMGYSQDTKGNFSLYGQEVYLDEGNKFNADWSGIRYGLNLNIELKI